MWPIIRVIISALLTAEISISSIVSGGLFPSNVAMPVTKTSEYTQYVDPFIGTGGTPWAAGMLSPAATVPFGMIRLGPDTSIEGGTFLFKTNTSGYYYEHRHILGFSYSRLSGTGIYDYGMFRVTPSSGRKNATKPQVLTFSHDLEEATPGYYAVYLPGAAAMCEMTATEHTGYQRYTFTSNKNAGLFIDASSFIGDSSVSDPHISVDTENGIITGDVLVRGDFSDRSGGLKTYYYAEVDTDIESVNMNDDNSGAQLNFGNIKNKPVVLRAGISFISLDNAKNNLYSEAETKSFDTVRKEADSLWNDRLSSIKISADNETKEIFYSSLYHTMIMPTDFTDSNGEYVGFDKKVHIAEGYTYRTDMSLWDTCRNVNALYTLIADDVQKDCIESLINMADQGGSLPRWPMGEGYTGSMLGCPANIVFAESYLKGYKFDVEKVYMYMKKSAETFDNIENREYAEYYDKYGYVPDDLVRDGYRGYSVSRTIEYSWADSVIAMFADVLGKTDDAAKYTSKSQNYRNVWNSDTKYFQAKNSDGTWGPLKPKSTAFYDEIFGTKTSKAYCEGSARQWRWSALHDIEGMIELFGSKEYFVSELDQFMKDASATRAAIDPGSGYWIGNQHDINYAYLFNNAGRPDLTQKWVRWTLSNRFSTDVNGLDGNDDGGTLSSWYVFSSIGFYPVAGTDKYWIGSPCVDYAAITLSDGKTLSVKVNNQSTENIYVESVFLNGKKLDSTTISHSMIAEGGLLEFNMK